MCENVKMKGKVRNGKGYKVFGVYGKKLIGDYTGFKARKVNTWLDEKDFRPSKHYVSRMARMNWFYGWMIFLYKKDAQYWADFRACYYRRKTLSVKKVIFQNGEKATTDIGWNRDGVSIIIAEKMKITQD